MRTRSQFNRSNRLIAPIALLAVAMFTTGNGYVQDSDTLQQAGEDDIVVTGIKEVEAAVLRYITSTLKKPAGGKHVGQYARFAQPVCPAVYGFSEANTDAIEKRMRSVALAADIDVAKDGCEPNIFVFAAVNGKETISDLRKKNHRLFGRMPIYQREKLSNAPGPVYGWKALQKRSTDTGTPRSAGDPSSISSSSTGAGNKGPDFSDDQYSAARTSVQSKIKIPVRSTFTHSYLLLEEKALVGLSTVQIADFAAMHTLLESKSDNGQPVAEGSILGLFQTAKGDAPQSISDWDLVLLSALYNTAPDMPANIQRSAMQQRFVKEITQDN